MITKLTKNDIKITGTIHLIQEEPIIDADFDLASADDLRLSIFLGTDKTITELENLKQQILSDYIKAEKYDSLMKANSEVVQHNIDITKEHEIVERLKAKIQNIKDQIKVAQDEDYADIDDYCMNLRLEELQSLENNK